MNHMWAIMVGLGGQENFTFLANRTVKGRAQRDWFESLGKHEQWMLRVAPLPRSGVQSLVQVGFQTEVLKTAFRQIS